ncbi:MAG: AbrB/MazE/SpoVT family DNA-binding domain-containing protein [Methanomassiliicoccales archaeon]|nr:MAG: AbrB/MazE/SpoVT family DNA-binding domain-containing protein [Methanomassiliicoccales archaeon]
MKAMFPHPEFQGSTTVGERGQIVLPAEMRKKQGINPGDKLLVISYPLPTGAWAIMLIESSVLNQVFSDMTEKIGEILEAHGKEEKDDTPE